MIDSGARQDHTPIILEIRTIRSFFMDYNAVIPEFVVSDIEKSRHFYCDLLGFSVEYDRPEEKFLFLSLETANSC